MKGLAAVDICCERTGPGVWAAKTATGAGQRTVRARTAIALAALIGAGRFLGHVLANRWSELADTVPIWSLICAALAAFALSLVARSMDMPLCVTLPLGTHVLWDAMMAVMVGLLVQLLIRTTPNQTLPRVHPTG